MRRPSANMGRVRCPAGDRPAPSPMTDEIDEMTDQTTDQTADRTNGER